MVIEERPAKVTEAIKLFLQGLGFQLRQNRSRSNGEFHCIFNTVKKSLIVLARQDKLWEGINSMAIIESEMISHEQLILSSQEH